MKCPACSTEMVYGHIQPNGYGSEGYKCPHDNLSFNLYKGVCDKKDMKRHAEYHGEGFGSQKKMICSHCGFQRDKSEKELLEYGRMKR